MEKAIIWFGKELRREIEDIVVDGCPFFGDLQWRPTSLPIRVGGLSLYSVVNVSSYAFMASRSQSWVLYDHILRDYEIYGMNLDFDMMVLVL